MGAQPLHPAQRTKIMSVVSTRAVVIEGAFLDEARGVWVMAQGRDELGGMCGMSPTCPPCACHGEKLKAKMGQGAALGGMLWGATAGHGVGCHGDAFRHPALALLVRGGRREWAQAPKGL